MGQMALRGCGSGVQAKEKRISPVGCAAERQSAGSGRSVSRIDFFGGCSFSFRISSEKQLRLRAHQRWISSTTLESVNSGNCCRSDSSTLVTTIPQPSEPTQSYTCIWDAWNRLVEVKDGASTVGRCDYVRVLRTASGA